MKGNDSIGIAVSFLSLLHALMVPLVLGAAIGSGPPHHQQHVAVVDHQTQVQPSSVVEEMRMGVAVDQVGGGAPFLHHPTTLGVRHVRSVDHLQQQPNEESPEDMNTNNNIIQSNSESEEDEPEAVHKAQKSFVSTPDIPFPVSQQHRFRMQTAPRGPALHKWLFRGIGQSPFPRGLRRDSHFIRFGRNSNMDFDSFNLATANNNGNKKNNFIRLGRENPRRNNFIRLGRSGLWANNERFGSKIGYFPDYYSQLFGGNPNIWDFAAQQPIPFDPSDVLQG